MTRNSETKRQASEPPKLIVARGLALNKINTQILNGRELKKKSINTPADLEDVTKEKNKWITFNKELLRQMFNNEVILKEYTGTYLKHFASLGSPNPTFWKQIEIIHDDIEDHITHLESILGRLELFPEDIQIEVQQVAPNPRDHQAGKEKNVFIVHGHDNAAKQTVARFISQIDLTPIILHEQPNRGQTIIEKLETNAHEAGFAVVLLTPDDVGRVKTALPDSDKPRARQNVMLELGYFLAHLGRANVCALYKPGVEIPSDYTGVLFIEMDSRDGWKRDLARELQAAKIPFNIHKMLQ